MLAGLLLTTTLLGSALAVGLTGFWKHRALRRRVTEPPVDYAGPFVFERPNRWLAIKCSNLQKVQKALRLHNAAPCPLTEGFTRLNESKLFISPPLKGWILVVGSSLPDAADDIDKLYHFLMRMADQLGSVQYFSANRVVGHHTWVRIENNRVYRAYSWAGEILWNQGETTAAERDLELKCYSYGDAPLPYPFSARESHAANTDKVTQLAARWSVDPLAVNNHGFPAALGITGDLSRRS